MVGVAYQTCIEVLCNTIFMATAPLCDQLLAQFENSMKDIIDVVMLHK